MATTLPPEQSLEHIGRYLFARREAILNSWRMSTTQDPELDIALTLVREEFNNLVPVILDTLDQRLRKQEEENNLLALARDHGLHRWYKGYKLPGLLREWKYLYSCLLREMEAFSNQHPDTTPGVLSQAYEIIMNVILESIDGSVMQYNDQQRIEATERARNLTQALEQINELTRQRGEILRSSSHDLRGSFSLVQGAAFMLDSPDSTQEERQEMVDMLNRNLHNIKSILTQFIDLARLEAGEEKLAIEEFDAARLLRELVDSVQPMATEKNLELLWDGPEELLVNNDSAKVQRIVQNLLINAIRYTDEGMISVSVSEEDNFRWMISIQDTGPGLPDGPISTLADQLRPHIESPGVLDTKLAEQQAQMAYQVQASSAGKGPQSQPKGEGIGLHVVKRLCELMNASMEIDTRPGAGTLFRIRFPTKYKNL